MDEAWQLIEPRLPWVLWGFDWDHCRRMRAGVVEVFVERDLSPAAFGEITRDDDLFGQLKYVACHNARGRRFLKRVKLALMNVDSDRFKHRVGLLDALA